MSCRVDQTPRPASIQAPRRGQGRGSPRGPQRSELASGVEEPRSGLTLDPGSGTHTHRSGAHAAEWLRPCASTCNRDPGSRRNRPLGLMGALPGFLYLRVSAAGSGHGPIVNKLLHERLERRNRYPSTATNRDAGQSPFVNKFVGLRPADSKPLRSFFDAQEATIADDHITTEVQLERFACGAESIAHN